MHLHTLTLIVSIVSAVISIVGIVVTALMAVYVVKQQTRFIRREARAEALQPLCSNIAVWMHRPTGETWTKMANEFWRARLWMNPQQAAEISQLIDSHKPQNIPAPSYKEYKTGENLFEILTKDIV